MCAIRGKEDSIKTVQIDSSGGTTAYGSSGRFSVIASSGEAATLGQKIGTWIHENDIDVVVENKCFAICANYIFVAAKNKTIKADSSVAWLGSSQRYGYIIQRNDTTLRDYLSGAYDTLVARTGVTPSDERRMSFIEGFKAYIPRKAMEEQTFLEKIGVSVDVMVYGLFPEPWKTWSGSDSKGWTFSVEDMAKFGIENVTYLGEGDYIDEKQAAERGLLLFDVPSATNIPTEPSMTVHDRHFWIAR